MEYRVCHCTAGRDGVCCQDRVTGKGNEWSYPVAPTPFVPVVLPKKVKKIEYDEQGRIKSVEYYEDGTNYIGPYSTGVSFGE